MDGTLGFYTPANLGLEDIATCAMKKGFKPSVQSSPKTTRLAVEYGFEFDGISTTGVWYIWASDALSLYKQCPSTLGEFEKRMIEHLRPRHIFDIMSIVPASRGKLNELLRDLLSVYGGWIVDYDKGTYYSQDFSVPQPQC